MVPSSVILTRQRLPFNTVLITPLPQKRNLEISNTWAIPGGERCGARDFFHGFSNDARNLLLISLAGSVRSLPQLYHQQGLMKHPLGMW